MLVLRNPRTCPTPPGAKQPCSYGFMLRIYIYIYNTPTYGCTSMFTFVLNVLDEVLGIGNLYCRPIYSAGSGPFARPKDFENRLLSDVLANFGRFLPPLILEQTLTALLADGQRHSGSGALPGPAPYVPITQSHDVTCTRVE